MENKNIVLNNGITIPVLGYGTWLIDNNKVRTCVRDAINSSYRHIDTAQAYGNEEGIGEEIKKMIREKLITREELFITSKVRAEHKDYKSAKESIDESLLKLKSDYLDLMIIHSPQPWKEVNQSENRYFEGNLEAYRALETAMQEGKVRAIGVSNFEIRDLENILKNSKVVPAVNQILAHIGKIDFEVLDFAKEKNIAIEAYSPLAHGEAARLKGIQEMADKYGVTVAQLCLRYVLDLGLIALPKTTSKDRMLENSQLDFEIEKEDFAILNRVDKLADYGEASYFPCYGGKIKN